MPFVHFFDGFRTSHELNTIEMLADDDLRALVPEELVAGAPRAGAVAGAAVHPRHRAEPGRLLPGARDGQPVLRPRARASCRTRWTRLAERTGRRYRLVDYTGHPEAERVIVIMGSGGETARETVACLEARGERVGVAQVRLYRPFPAQALVEALPATRAPRRRARPHEGARLDRRAALPRRGRGADRWHRGRRGRCRRSSAAATACPRRSSRRAWSPACFDELGARAAAAPVHDRHQRRRLRHEPALRRVARHRAGRHGARGLLRPGLRRDGRREQEHDQDPRRRGGPARAGLLRLRLEEVRLADGLAPALRARSRSARRTSSRRRASSAATSSGCSTAPRCSAARRPARRCCSTARTRRTRSGTRCPARSRSRSSPSDIDAVRDRRRPDRARGGPRRADQHRAADLLLRHLRRAAARARRSSGSRRRSRRPTAGAAPRWSSATRPRSTARWRACTRSRCPSA